MPRRRDPMTDRMLMEGITPVTSEATGITTYRARYTYMDGTGQRKWGDKTHKSAEDAEAWLLEAQLAIRRGTHTDPSALTVAAYFERWFARKAPDWSGSRQKTVRLTWEKYFRGFFGAMKLQRVRRDTLQQLVDLLTAEGLSPRTVHLYMIGMVSLFDAARVDGIIETTPATDLIYPRRRQTPRPVWSVLQLRSFLNRTRDDAYGPLWAFVVATGCRIGEALALQWSDLDLENGLVWLHRTRARDTDGRYRDRTGTKTQDAGRTVPLEPWIIAVLARMPRAGSHVFHKGDGSPLMAGTVRYQWQRAVRAAGLPVITLHDVRHSVATAMIAAGVSERIVQDILGHADIRTTLVTYAHVDTDMQRQGTAAMGRLLGVTDTTTLPQERAEN